MFVCMVEWGRSGSGSGGVWMCVGLWKGGEIFGYFVQDKLKEMSEANDTDLD